MFRHLVSSVASFGAVICFAYDEVRRSLAAARRFSTLRSFKCRLTHLVRSNSADLKGGFRESRKSDVGRVLPIEAWRG